MKRLLALTIAFSVGFVSIQSLSINTASAGSKFKRGLGIGIGIAAGVAILGAITNDDRRRYRGRYYSRRRTAEKVHVRKVQTALNSNGYDAGYPDGRIGENTRSAIAAFQRDRGFEATGRLTKKQTDILLAVRTRPTETEFTADRPTEKPPIEQTAIERSPAEKSPAEKPQVVDNAELPSSNDINSAFSETQPARAAPETNDPETSQTSQSLIARTNNN